MTQYVLRKAEIDSMQGLDKTHFLNKEAVRLNKSLGDETGLTGIGFHLIEVPPGKRTTEFHRHYFEDECVFVLEGTATAIIEEQEYAISSGDFIGYPKGGPAHTIVNTGDVPLRCLVAGERLAHDVADYPALNKRIFRNANLPPDVVDISDLEHPSMGQKK